MPKFITAQTNEEKLVLNYLNKVCQEALEVCKKNGIEKYEDFSQMVTQIGKRNEEQKGAKYGVRVGVKGNDLVLSLKNIPQLGATKTIKMKEHLGHDDQKFMFTRQAVEKELSPDNNKQNNSHQNLNLNGNKTQVDERLTFAETPEKENSKPLSFDNETNQPIPQALSFSTTVQKPEPTIIENKEIVDIPETLNFTTDKTQTEPVIEDLAETEPHPIENEINFSANQKNESLIDDLAETVPNYPQGAIAFTVAEKKEEDLLAEILAENKNFQVAEQKDSTASETLEKPKLTYEEKQALRDQQYQKDKQERENRYQANKQTIEQEKLRTEQKIKKAKVNSSMVEIADKVENQSEEVDGFTILGASIKMAAVAHALNNNQTNNADKQKLAKTVARLQKLQERAENLNERSEKLGKNNLEETKERINTLQNKAENLNKRSDKLINNNQNIPPTNQTESLIDEITDKTDTLNKNSINEIADKADTLNNDSINEITDETDTLNNKKIQNSENETKQTVAQELQDSVNKLNQEINKTSDEEIKPIQIDQNAELNVQLDQINQVLDQLETKLNELEARIEKLEEKLLDQKDQITENQPNDQKVETIEDTAQITLDETQRKEPEIKDKIPKAQSTNNDEKEPVTLIENIPDTPDKEPKMYAAFLAVVNETDLKYYDVNPDHNSIIQLGDNTVLKHSYQGDTTTVEITKGEGTTTEELFKATIRPDEKDTDIKKFAVETDKLSEDDLSSIQDGFEQQLAEIDKHLKEKEKQINNQSTSIKQEQLSM